jgi:hypothetical protein
MRPLRIALLLLIVGLCLPGAVAAQEGPPPPPHAFLGEVTINGQPAPVGTRIEGRGEGIRTGIPGNPITVREPGRYGGPSMTEEKLVLQGRVADGLALAFFVDGVRAECALPDGTWGESFPFQSGSVTPLNLRVGSAPAPVAPTAGQPVAQAATPAAEPTAAPPTPALEQTRASPTRATAPAQLAPSATLPSAAILTTPTILPEVATGEATMAAPEAQQAVSVDEPTLSPTSAPTAQPASTSARPSPTPLLQARGQRPAATPQPELASDQRVTPILPVAGGLALVGATVAGALYILRRR